MLVPNQKSLTTCAASGMPAHTVNRRPKRPPIRAQAGLGPVVWSLTKTAATAGAMTAVFGGLLEALAPHGQRDVKRAIAGMKFGGAVGSSVALGVAVPNAVSTATAAPLGVVVGLSLMGAWSVLRIIQARQGR